MFADSNKTVASSDEAMFPVSCYLLASLLSLAVVSFVGGKKRPTWKHVLTSNGGIECMPGAADVQNTTDFAFAHKLR